MDICIFYEHAQRELNNDYLLKFELEKRGYSVDLIKVRESHIPYFVKPKLIITPWAYDYESTSSFRVCFFKGFDKVLNLQYEQVISQLWLKGGYHCPSGLTQNATHVCWSEKIKRRLMSVGVPENNCLVVGDLKTDFSKNPFRQIYLSKEDLAKEFNIPLNHKWNIFISSFSYINLEKDLVDSVIEKMGDELYFREMESIQIKSQIEIINWIEKFIQKNNNVEFIYRPHPSEFDSEMLVNLDKKYDNFHYISKYSIQEWIVNCDIINTWYSTSLIEIYVLGKSCNILRPFHLNEYFDVPYMIEANYIEDYDSFERNNIKENSEFPVSREKLDEYYLIDDDFVYKKIADHIEWMIQSDECKSKFYKIPPFLETLGLVLSRIFSKNLFALIKGFFSKQSSQFDNEEYWNEKRIMKLKKFVYDD